MQFKHPEILYFLLALLIPIFIHLFQLQRFVKVPFTNVAFLKKLELQSRRSSRLKKWLTLLMRLLALAAMIIAFAQPFNAKSDTAKPWETIVILDNSISMQAENEQGELLKSSVQNLLEDLPEKGSFSLFTQDETFENLDVDTFRETLKKVDYIGYNKPLLQLMLKVQNHIKNDPSKQYSVLWITDLQKTHEQETISIPEELSLTLIPLKAEMPVNISIDTVKIENYSRQSVELYISVRNFGKSQDNVAISGYHNDILLGKTFVDCPENSISHTTLKLTDSPETIMLQMDVEDRYDFDDYYYLSLQQPKAIKVLEVSDKSSFIGRILNDESMDFSRVSTSQFPYDRIEDYDFIILNEIQNIEPTLVQTLMHFVEKGGSLTYIPSEKSSPKQVNVLLNAMSMGNARELKKDSLLVTKIHYDHSLFNNVFERRVENFQYPMVKTYFDLSSINAVPVLSFQDNRPFLVDKRIGKGHFYCFVSALNTDNSNFTNAPLVVPVFYKMALNADTTHNLSVRLGETQTVDIKQTIDQEKILTLVQNDFSVIPLQIVKPNEVTLVLDETLKNPGFYEVKNDNQTLTYIACNTEKTESNMSYWSMDEIKQSHPNIHVENSITSAINDLNNDRTIHEYFKWFLLLALVFLLSEMLILKYL